MRRCSWFGSLIQKPFWIDMTCDYLTNGIELDQCSKKGGAVVSTLYCYYSTCQDTNGIVELGLLYPVRFVCPTGESLDDIGLKSGLKCHLCLQLMVQTFHILSCSSVSLQYNEILSGITTKWNTMRMVKHSGDGSNLFTPIVPGRQEDEVALKRTSKPK